jgi:hypothetical protein
MIPQASAPLNALVAAARGMVRAIQLVQMLHIDTLLKYEGKKKVIWSL